MNHSLYFRRRGKVVVPPSERGVVLPLEVAATLSINLEELGYALSPALLEACRTLSFSQLDQFQRDLVATLSRLIGAEKAFKPMYLNFPRQVMDATEAELYMNALTHYWSGGQLFPVQRKKLRFLLKEPPPLKYIDLGSLEDFEGLFVQIATANVAVSDQDKDDLRWFVTSYGDRIQRLLPQSVDQRENLAYVSVLLLNHTTVGEAFIRPTIKSATDVLRLAVALSGGDVSLAAPTKFAKLTRPQRRFLLELLEERPNALEDMLRWKSRWKRLGERLHPREMAKRYPKAAAAFEVLRNDLPARTFSGRVETALARVEVVAAVAELTKRPGDFARRLDHVLRLDESQQTEVLEAFRQVASKVSTPVLLQAWHHFAVRSHRAEFRTFFPKGLVAKSHSEPNRLPPLPDPVVCEAAFILETAMRERFRDLPSLGKTYVDPALRDYPIPFPTRSASRALRTLPRGSRIPLPDATTLRMFVWWTNGKERTDIDLSAEFLGEGYVHLDTVAYYDLKNYGGAHSGDIVDAPHGASEFIDVSRPKLIEHGVRYVAMILTSYTRQPYVELPECFAGWMTRQWAESGEIYEPRTVQDRLDLTADTKIAIPIVFDLKDNVAIWCDMALRNHPNFENAVAANLSGIAMTIRALVELRKPTIYDLLSLHAQARGQIVESAAEAETVLSVEAGTTFELDRIASEFMA